MPLASCKKKVSNPSQSFVSPPPPPTLGRLLTGHWIRAQRDAGSFEHMIFDGNGHLDVYSSDQNSVQNAAANYMGRIYCTYSTDGNILSIDIIGADNRAVSLFRRGQFCRINVTIESPDSICLSQAILADGDTLNRFTRIH